MKQVKKVIFNVLAVIIGIIFLVNLYSFIMIRVMHKDIAPIFGYSTLEVVSGSMEPTISVGDIILINTNVKNINKYDIVTFYDENGAFVTHRVLAVEKDGSVLTQGDANNTVDGYIKRDKLVGKYIKKYNNAGKVIAAFKSPMTLGLILIIGVLTCVFMSLDKNGKPILDENELEFEEFKKSKNSKVEDKKKEHKEEKTDLPVKKSTSKKKKSKGKNIAQKPIPLRKRD